MAALSMTAPVLSTRVAGLPRLGTARPRVQPVMSRRSIFVRAEAPKDVEQVAEKVEEVCLRPRLEYILLTLGFVRPFVLLSL